MMRRLLHPLVPALAIAALLAPACSGDDGGDPPVALSPEGERGREVAQSAGCAGCHGANGGGGVGPSWIGLYGSSVELDDGSTVTADDAYLRESIRDPSAKRVAGFSSMMPATDLSDEQIDDLIAYIEDLAAAE